MSISVFSNHFIELYQNYLLGTQPFKDKIEPLTLSEAVDGWIARKDLANIHWCPELFMSLHPEDEIADRNVFNHICADYNLRKIEKWATKNILLQVRKDWKIQTQNVKLRIVAGMLNSLDSKGYISHDENTYIFNNIVNNMRNLRSDLINSDLPF